MGEKPTEATDQALTSASDGQSSTATAPTEEKTDPLADVDISIDPATGRTSFKFAYVCMHCGGSREIDSGRYSGACPTCGQTAQSGNEMLDAIARGEYSPTYDRSSGFYP
jgi:hypothetical protein